MQTPASSLLHSTDSHWTMRIGAILISGRPVALVAGSGPQLRLSTDTSGSHVTAHTTGP